MLDGDFDWAWRVVDEIEVPRRHRMRHRDHSVEAPCHQAIHREIALDPFAPQLPHMRSLQHDRDPGQSTERRSK